jgi:hypothetical protein
MHIPTVAAVLAGLGVASAQETVLGAFIFSRHGDRTAKSTPPANLTDLGYLEVFNSATYFRNRYIASDAEYRIHGINDDLVKQSQISASAPTDTVLQNSALAFLQGLYPPVGGTLGSNTLRNGTVVQSPLNGYQLIPLQTVSTGTNSENSAWLQGTSNCANAQISSNNYFQSSEFNQTSSDSQSLYDRVTPMVNRTFTASQTNFKNAYVIWDLLNVASIHNASDNFPSADLLTTTVFSELFHLASTHEFNLAYNSSDPVRAIAGAILADQIVSGLNATITSQGKTKLNIEFGAYGNMLAFFGLTNLTSVNSDFYGIPDYASTMTFELVTNATVNASTFPSEDQISVRFLFHNGTASNTSTPTEYPLFGQSRSPLPWQDFANSMGKFSIKSQADWCSACGNSTGVCSPASLNDGGESQSSASSSHTSGISKAVAGVIGAMVTLAVILGVELLIMLVAGLRLVRKKNLQRAAAAASHESGPGPLKT